MGWIRLWCIVLFGILASANSLKAQQVTQLKGYFLKDTIKVGEPVQYVLCMKYEAAMEVRFPDSTFSFAPFEFIEKVAFPTRTDLERNISTDSVIYTLSTFEMDSEREADSPMPSAIVHYLSMPIVLLAQGDTSVVRTEADSVRLKPLLLTLPDTLRLIANTQYVELKTEFHHLYALIALGGLVVFAFVLFLVFGERIKKAYTLRRLKRNYERFSMQFARSLQGALDALLTEKSLGLWKSYLENLQNIPFTTYTSKEIEEMIQDKTLAYALKSLDRAIYGSMITEETRQSLVFLEQYAKNAYQDKVEEVRNA